MKNKILNLNEFIELNKYNKLNEAEITTIEGFNQESDFVILLMDELKTNKKYIKIITANAMEYYSGGNIKNIYPTLSMQIHSLLNPKLINLVVNKLNNMGYNLFIPEDKKDYNLVAKIFARGLLFDFKENPFEIKKLCKNKQLTDMIDNFSSNRGKEKFMNMYKNNH